MLTPENYMDRALFHAERGRGRTSPNPMVGAVVVSPDGSIVGHGYHQRAGEPRPFVILKAATTLDGRIAAEPGRRMRLTSAEADRHAHRFRAEVDAIAVGSGTILADDPLLTARGAFRDRPLARVILDRRLR